MKNEKGAAIGTDPVIESAVEYVKELFKDDFGGHDAAHSLRVFHNAMMIAAEEPDCDLRTAALAALLHDADDHKLFDTENNANARAFLSSAQIGQDIIEEIITAINSVSFSRNRGKTPSTIAGKVVQDADRLDAIGAVGIARTFAYGGEHRRPLEGSIQHFYDKLLLLKDEMNTGTGKRMAEARHDFMLGFLKEFEHETGE